MRWVRTVLVGRFALPVPGDSLFCAGWRQAVVSAIRPTALNHGWRAGASGRRCDSALGGTRRYSSELYRVVLAISGNPRLGQDGRAAQPRPGEFAIYDFARPYELAYDSAVELAVFGFPRDLPALPPGAAGRATAVPIAADQGTGALASRVLRRVVLDLETYRPASAARLSTMMDLVTTFRDSAG